MFYHPALLPALLLAGLAVGFYAGLARPPRLTRRLMARGVALLVICAAALAVLPAQSRLLPSDSGSSAESPVAPASSNGEPKSAGTTGDSTANTDSPTPVGVFQPGEERAATGVADSGEAADSPTPVGVFQPGEERAATGVADSGEAADSPTPVGVFTSAPIRLVAQSIDLDVEIIPAYRKGETWNLAGLDLRLAWLEGTSPPGPPGNTVLAGHVSTLRTRHGPFLFLHRLEPGDLILVYTAERQFRYKVRELAVVRDTDIYVTEPTGSPQLTLLTCTGWDAESERYNRRRVVFADLVGSSPLRMSEE